MEIKNSDQALEILKQAQCAILDNGAFMQTSFRFEISINPTNLSIELGSRNGFMMRRSDDAGYKAFSGKTIEEAVSNFLTFFINGGSIKIDRDANGFSFHASLRMENGKWITDKVETGGYSCSCTVFNK